MQRLGTALSQPGIIRTRNRTDRVLKESEAFKESDVMLGKDNGAHDDIGVSIDALYTKTSGREGWSFAMATTWDISIKRRVGFIGDSIHI
jgi:hypothetical protein